MKNKIKYILVMLVTAIGFMAMAGSVAKTTKVVFAAGETGTTTADSLNVRTGPGTTYPIMAYNGSNVALTKGTTVTILETVNGWYRASFQYGGVGLEGYVSGTYVTVASTSTSDTTVATATPTAAPVTTTPAPIYRTVTTYKAIKVVSDITAKTSLRKTAGGKYYKVSGKTVTLRKKKAVSVIGQQKKKGVIWYNISFKYKNKTRKAYVSSAYVKFRLKSAAPAQIYYNSKGVYVRKGASKKKPYYKVNGKKVKLTNKLSVTIVKEKTTKGVKWFYVSFNYNGKNRRGYVPAANVKLAKTKTTKTEQVNAVLSDAQFEANMTAQGFPESYKPYLRALHSTYPYWQFNAFATSMTWETAVKKENVVGVNLLPKSRGTEWKSQAAGAYDAATGTYTVFDGTTWVAASEKAIRYYMDPRNWLTANNIFQFETLDYQSTYQTSTGVKTILKNTPFYSSTFQYAAATGQATMSFPAAFVAAAKEAGVSPYHLAARVKQEVVTGTNSTTIAVTGTNETYPGISNYYNIGATHATVPALNGLKWASTGTTYLRPWTDPYRSIVGGALYIGENYITRGQNTIYLQKFNMTSTSTYSHQYMANVEVGPAESLKAKNAYGDNITSVPIVFSIPVYKDMPETISAKPAG